MPITAAYIEASGPEQLLRIARYIQEYIKEHQITKTQFVKECVDARERLFPGDPTVAPMIRERLERILGLLRNPQPKQVAKVPSVKELDVIAYVLRRTVDDLLLSDPVEDEHHAQHISTYLSQAQADAKEFLTWGEFLPCSLETPEFIVAHHAALFNDPQAAEPYNNIGLQRRRELHDMKDKRPWKFTQLNFLSDLEAVAYGKDEYGQVPQKLRQDCLDNVIDLLQKPWNIQLIVADDIKDKGVQDLKNDMQQWDTILTFDEAALLLRDHLGITYTSDRARHIGYWRGVLQEFIKAARFRTQNEVIDLLKYLRNPIG